MPEFITKDSGARQEYDSGMRRDTQDGKPMFGLLRPEGVPYDEQFLTRCAALMTRGIEKYGHRNWEKANSEEELARFKESAERHLHQYLAGETDEDHAAAVFFNLLAAITTEYKMRQRAAFGFDIAGASVSVEGTLSPEHVQLLARTGYFAPPTGHVSEPTT